MQMEQQVSFNCEACPYPENILFKEGDCVVVTCSQDHVAPAQPVKKQTRQWAAWTRQEEESFFTALRQVGKNFEKITTRVQSKNKDQVRHYYYRLVRRMNKLLGPELCLDAKNSKDTNAAMLRWWSLLEKYSCKASKLHLKPRRFKIFIETLEHQLLKDRKKNIRKRHSQGENCSTTASTTVSNQARASGPDTRPVKKARQRRKKGSASTAAYKRWEKAAIAGVSLVADAAEHLERTGVDKVAEHVQDILGQKDFDPVGKDVPSLPTSSQNLFIENNTITSMKLKLQLFPIDEGTRRALEMDNHNPHLELTLSTRKKISSVLEHLNRKWGSSSIASGELMLFPYYVQKENTVGCQKWTQDSVLSAADVYALIGSPPIFRLRYGWFSNAQHGSATFQKLVATSDILGEHNVNMNDKEEQNVESIPVSTRPTDRESNKLIDHCKDQLVSAENIAPSSMDVPTEMTGCIIVDPNKNRLESSNLAPTISLQRRETTNRAIMRQVEHMDYLRLRNGTALSAGEWADSLTNISIGDLLPESSHNMDANCIDSAIPFTCDSFDAAIAAHIREHQSKSVFHPTLASHSSSIWDAEETCDGFSFQKNSVFCEKVQIRAPEACRDSAMGLVEPGTAVEEELPEDMEPMDADPANGDPMDECQSDPHNMDNSAKDLSGLTDIYWPDSLGPLDLDIPSCRYQSEDLILSDSIGGLNRLIASSLDAFQNCSFFGLDKKEPVSTIEARETASFSDYKIGSEV